MNKKKYIILGIILVLILGIGSTFAWYVWQSSDDEVKTISATLGVARVIYDEGSDISADIFPVATKEEGVIKEVTVKAMDRTSYNLTFNLYLDILEMDDIFKHESFRYAIYRDGTKIKEGNFTEEFKECTVNNTTHLVLVEGQNITALTSTYTLYLWIDGFNYTNPSEMQRKSISLKLHASGENAILEVPKTTLVETISNLYNNAEKTTITNNGIVYNRTAIYDNDDDDITSGGLMNDRLGTMSVGANDGNIRYYGATPNNYVDIGDVYEDDYTLNNWEKFGWYYENTEECYLDNNYCDTEWSDWGYEDAKACYEDEYGSGISSVEDICEATTFSKGTPILYRIIGLFKDVELSNGSRKDLIKVMRNDPIGDYSWDTSASTINVGDGINEWSQADLMKLLNPGYNSETVGGSLYWNSGSGTCYSEYNNGTRPCDFTSKGLSTSVQSNIEEVKWNLGGWNSSEVFANQIYEYERQENVVKPGTTCSGTYCNDTVTRTTEWIGKVALAYPSDYGYAVDLSSCSSQLDSYYNCNGTNWMYPSMTFEGNLESWLLTPYSSYAYGAWLVSDDGVWCGDSGVHIAFGVSPVFYLDSELTIESGDGSSSNPYRLS